MPKSEHRTPGTEPSGRIGEIGPVTVQSQIELPFRIALGIVMQGFRIRLGRSLITIAGVVLGVAFIMANVTNQIARKAVSEEDAMRSTIRRMVSFLSAETGPATGKTFGAVQTGPLAPSERRLVAELVRSGLAQLNYCTDEPGAAEAFGLVVRKTPLDQVARDARVILVMGEGQVSADTWQALHHSAPGTIIASTSHVALNAPELSDLRLVQLEREPTPD
jgi:hypothetical protein